MPKIYSKASMRQAIERTLQRHFSKEIGEASKEHFFRAAALILRDILTERYVETQNQIEERGSRQVHYMCMEFLVGRLFLNNAYNLGLLGLLKDTFEDIGIDLTDLMEVEPDAGLGNGGLGRLAACFIDSMATLGIPSTGYSIRYEYGIFKQKIVDGMQIELPDPWLDVGDVWLIPQLDEVREVHFGGHLEEQFIDGQTVVRHVDYQAVQAVPHDMLVSGYDSQTVGTLRLWDAKSAAAIDMKLFSAGEYMKAMEQQAMAQVICKVLYPGDSHFEGQSLRLKQQYFFVSATIQDIVQKHKATYGTLRNFADKHVIHINDTHPAVAIPELMRILLDEEGYNWDDAWDIVSRSFAYTNHTVMPEALERWPQGLFEMLLPRITVIVREINERFCRMLWDHFPGQFDLISRLAITTDGQVLMANLAVAGSFSVNGVSELHSQILKDSIFCDYNKIMPGKFTNVTNGIAHRRWLCEANPHLAELITDSIGDLFLTCPSELKSLAAYANDTNFKNKLCDIKYANKRRLADYIYKKQGIRVEPSSMFDVQVKRLHEYKRQLLNVLHILKLYFQIKENPMKFFVPRTFIFGAKASASYTMAKRIIQLINSIANHINGDDTIDDLLKVVFIEDYKVSLAEMIMPAAELSEQISVAGKEASGTGNMKFMINGALTIGTLDGANVEMHEVVGDDNIFIFGLKVHEVEDMVRSGYSPMNIYDSDYELKRVIDSLSYGFADGVSYHDIVSSLLIGNNPDPYMVLADFNAYCTMQERAAGVYRDQNEWNRMSVNNIAASGCFAADRSINDYARNIWKVTTEYRV